MGKGLKLSGQDIEVEMARMQGVRGETTRLGHQFMLMLGN